MKILFMDYYGAPVAGNTAKGIWEYVQGLHRLGCPMWHDGTLVSIERDDKGCAYAAPGTFTVKDRAGHAFKVELS